MACPRCGAEVPEGARFCPACGLELVPSSGREERKLVSILFVDQVGSTARADGADPEDVRDRNRTYYDETRRRLERFGGTLEKYAGDAVMAVFGAPRARSDDAERAVRAGLSILDGVHELNEKNPTLDLEVRIGICTGEAIVEVEAGPESSIATGDVVNTAARLETAAPPGRVVVGEETYRLTKHAFRYEALPPVIAKGKREPVRAWLALEAFDVGAAAAPLSPLVGRDRELVLVRAVWERTVGGRQPQLVSILGPAGIGKSRLAREISAEIEAGGGRALWGQSVGYEQQTPYHASTQMVRRAAGIFENDPIELAREKLAAFVEDVLPDAERRDATRYLSLMLGLGIDEPAKETIQIHFAMRRIVEQLAERHPVLLVFEDAHWADDALLSLISYLATRIQDHSVMIAITARPEFLEERPAWAAGVAAHTSIPLGPLASDDAAAIASALLGTRGETVSRIVATAEGNPLFLEELAASIEDETAGKQLPATVRSVITGRIDALPADARDALLAASVIGRTFWRGVLAQIGGVADIDAALESLEQRALIQRRWTSQVEGETEYAFKHDLICDTAYATLPRASRRDLHTETARVLESLAAEPDEIAWILAHHWEEAGRPAQAVRYLVTAADRARDALAVDQTHELLSHAVELSEADARDDMLLKRAMAMVELEDYPRAASELDDLIPRLEGTQRIEALIGRSRAAYWTEQTDEALSAAENALALARELSAPEFEPPALGLVGGALGMRGGPGDLAKAVEFSDRALDSWKPNTFATEHGHALHNQATHCYWIGNYEAAVRRAREAHEIAGNDPGGGEALLRGAGLEGLVLAGLGRYEEAIAIANDAIALAERIGRPKNVMMNYSTLPLREIFAVEEARVRSEEVASRLGPSSFNMPWMNARCDLLAADVLDANLGHLEKEWPSLWDEAVASRAWVRWHISGRAAAIRTEYELGRGNVEDALLWGRRALDLATASSRVKYESLSRILIARALVAQGAREAAAEELRLAVAGADRLGSPLLRWQARATLADSGIVLGNDDPDSLRRDAIAIIRDVVAGLTPEHAAGYLAAPAVASILEHA